MQLTDNLDKQTKMWGKLPVGAMELKTEREKNEHFRKEALFILLDMMALGLQTMAIVLSSKGNCAADKIDCQRITLPVNLYMIAMIGFSFIIDWRIILQISKNYINKNVATASAVLDLFIFFGLIWEITTLIRIHHEVPSTEVLVIGLLLIGATSLRVMNILYVVLYAVFIMPLYCLPEWCICRKWLGDDTIDNSVLDHLKLQQWVYNDEAMRGNP